MTTTARVQLGPWHLYRTRRDPWETGWSVTLLCPTCRRQR